MQVRHLDRRPGRPSTGALVASAFRRPATRRASPSDGDRDLGGHDRRRPRRGEIAGKPSETVARCTRRTQPSSASSWSVSATARSFTLRARRAYAGTAVRYLGKRGVQQASRSRCRPRRAERDARRLVRRRGRDRRDDGHDDLPHRAREADRARRDRRRRSPPASFDRAALEAGAARGRIIGEAVNFARPMALTPANDMTPDHPRAKRARKSPTATGSSSMPSTRSGWKSGHGRDARRLARQRRTRDG